MTPAVDQAPRDCRGPVSPAPQWFAGRRHQPVRLRLWNQRSPPTGDASGAGEQGTDGRRAEDRPETPVGVLPSAAPTRRDDQQSPFFAPKLRWLRIVNLCQQKAASVGLGPLMPCATNLRNKNPPICVCVWIPKQRNSPSSASGHLHPSSIVSSLLEPPSIPFPITNSTALPLPPRIVHALLRRSSQSSTALSALSTSPGAPSPPAPP